MKKKSILLSIISIYLLSILLLPVISADETVVGLFDSDISFNYEPKPLEPTGIGVQKSIDINVKYQINAGPFVKLLFGRRITRLIVFGPGYISKLKQNPIVNISLSVESPSWCDANLDPSYIKYQLTKDLSVESTIKLTYELKKSAPALANDTIKITANFDGFWTINAVDNSTSIVVIPEYISNISAQTDKAFTIPPLENYTLPINITNNGNGESQVNLSIEGSEVWNYSFSKDSITIPQNETKKVTLTVKAPKGFENETFKIKVESRSTNEDFQGDSSYLIGKTFTFNINFKNDGSLKEDKDELTIDTTLLIVALFVTIIIIVILIIIKRKIK